MKIIIIKCVGLFLVLLLFQSCLTSSMAYRVDHGKDALDYRYHGQIEENFYTLYLPSVYRGDHGISELGIRPKEEINIHFVDTIFTFLDGTELESVMYYSGWDKYKYLNRYYTCEDFLKKRRKYKGIRLTLVYDIDSLGFVTRHEKEYDLVKERYWRWAVH